MTRSHQSKPIANSAGEPLEPRDAADDRMRRALHSLREFTDEASDRHHWLEAMINHIPDYIYAKDVEGRFLFVNDAVVRDNGYRHASELIGRTDFDLHPFEAAAAIAEVEKRVMETGLADLGIEEQALGGTQERWLMMSRVPLRDEHGDTIGVVGMSRDITARKLVEHRLETQAHLLGLVAGGTPLDRLLEEIILMVERGLPQVRCAVMTLSDDGRALTLAAAPSLPADLCRRMTRIWLAQGDRSDDRFERWNGLAGAPLSPSGLPPADGGVMAGSFGFASCLSRPLRSSQGEVLGSLDIYCVEDTEVGAELHELIALAAQLAAIAIERRRAEARISYLARHDALTGLPNRLHMESEFEHLRAAAKRAGRGLALAFIDLDNFKVVNDSLGHAAGDELLKTVARRMLETVRDDGMVVRVGGDEFIVVAPLSQSGPADELEMFERLRERIAEAISLEGLTIHVTSSMGLALCPQHGSSLAELLQNADTAMYRAKEDGRDNIQRFSAEMAEKAREKLERTEEIRRGIAEGEFVLHFQPQLNALNGSISGVEALVRWQHPRLGLLFPGQFIPLAEETGLIAPLGDWVLNEACRQARKWQSAGLPRMTMSVNVSARQFREKTWVADVADALAGAGLDPADLELEITESLIMQDVNGAIERMRELTALGVNLAIDDFGTGYSSLSALKRFPVTRLKIDRSFVADLSDDEDDRAITAAIISLAQKLNLEVIAEGVETADQADFLISCGCNHMQGYLFGQPQDAGVLAVALADLSAIASKAPHFMGLANGS